MPWSWILTALGVASLYLAGSRPLVGWPLALVNQLLWAVYAVTTRQYGFLAGAVCYAAVFSRNWALAGSARSTWHKQFRPAQPGDGPPTVP